MSKVKPDLYKCTLVVRGGALPPGEHIERYATKRETEARLDQLRDAAREAGEPIVWSLIPPRFGKPS